MERRNKHGGGGREGVTLARMNEKGMEEGHVWGRVEIV